MTSPASPGYTPISVRDFENAVEAVETLIAKVRAEFNRLVDLANAFITNAQEELEDSWIDRFFEVFTGDIGDALGEIRRLLEHARSQIVQLLDQAQSSVAGSVPVVSLFHRAYDLAEKVNRPLTGMHGQMTGSGDIDFWRGAAKETYEKRVVSQQQAVASASEKVEALAVYLGEAATANMTYMADLGERMGEVYGATTAACVDLVAVGAGAVTQVMDALAHFSEVIGTAVSQAVGYATALGARIADVLQQILVLETAKSDLIGLTPDGRWPAPVAS